MAAFEAILAGATEDYRLARREDFTLVEQGKYTGSVERDRAVALGAA